MVKHARLKKKINVNVANIIKKKYTSLVKTKRKYIILYNQIRGDHIFHQLRHLGHVMQRENPHWRPVFRSMDDVVKKARHLITAVEYYDAQIQKPILKHLLVAASLAKSNII